MFPYKSITGIFSFGTQDSIVTSTGILTLPPGTDTLVDLNGTQTLNNKTIGSGWTLQGSLNIGTNTPNIGSINGGLGNVFIEQLYCSHIASNNAPNLQISQDVVPTTSGGYNLGTATLPWNNINATGTLQLSGNGGLILPTSGGTGTLLNYYEEGSFTLTLTPAGTGGSAGTGTVYFTRIGKIVFWNLYNQGGGITCTTGSTAGVITLSGIPTRLLLLAGHYGGGVARVQTSGTISSTFGWLDLISSGQFLYTSPSGGTFPASTGGCGFYNGAVSYTLN
jgi:hypothetical protein